MLGLDYRPLYATGSGEPMPPRFPQRVQHFMYACAKAAAIVDGKMKDRPMFGLARAPAPRSQRRESEKKGLYLPDGSFVSAER